MKTRLLLFTLLTCSKTIHSQNPATASFDKNILGNILIKTIAFDKQDNAWIGTFRHGLVKYNEKETIYYNSKNSPIGDSASVEDIKVDSKGNVWIVGDGLVKYDGKKFTKFDSRNSKIPSNYIRSIAIDSKDNIWFTSCAANFGGVVKYNGQTFSVFTPSNSALPVSLVQDLTIDKNDNVWLAVSQYVNQSYLIKINGEKWTVYGSKELGFTPYYLSSIKTDSNNLVYCTISYMLSSSWYPNQKLTDVFTFDGKKSEIIKTDGNFGSSALTIDKSNHVWCSNTFLSFHNGKGWYTYPKNYGGINAIEQAGDNLIWLGTAKGVFIQSK